MTKQSIADVGGPWIEEEQRWGGPGGAHLRLSYRVTCAAHYYGSGCEVLCRPRDDAFGHYTCSSSGEIVCKAGWTGDYCSKRKYSFPSTLIITIVIKTFIVAKSLPGLAIVLDSRVSHPLT